MTFEITKNQSNNKVACFELSFSQEKKYSSDVDFFASKKCWDKDINCIAKVTSDTFKLY